MGFWASRPPAPSTENYVNYVSYLQMLEDIETMTQKPHPSGSQELADIRSYLLSLLDDMGVSYQVYETVVSVDEIVEEENASQQSKSDSLVNNSEFISNPDNKINGKQAEAADEILSEAVFDENGNITLYNILVKLDAPDTNDGILFMAHYDPLKRFGGMRTIARYKKTSIFYSPIVRN